jgi:hypothetical protein
MSNPTTKGDAATLDAAQKYRQRAAARVAEIKGALLKWLEPRDSHSVCITKCRAFAAKRPSIGGTRSALRIVQPGATPHQAETKERRTEENQTGRLRCGN